MEDDIIFKKNGRQLNFFNMEDDLNFFLNGRRPQFFLKMEDNKIMQPKTFKIKTIVLAPLRVT